MDVILLIYINAVTFDKSVRRDHMISTKIYIDRNWKFDEDFDEEMISCGFNESRMSDVDIPHNVKEMPLHYFDESIYQMECCYRRHLTAEKGWSDSVILITFEGVAHESTLYVNGNEVCTHTCGYTAFTADITQYLNFGKDNVITLKVSSMETLDQPPFGYAIDYMTYGGIYRDVYLEIKPKTYISRIATQTKLIDRYEKEGKRFCKKGAVISRVHTAGDVKGCMIETSIRKKGEEIYSCTTRTCVTQGYTECTTRADDVELWDPENPALYELRTRIIDGNDEVTDERTDTIGFRKAVFKENGFFINGRKFRIRGLNRHQSYAYAGYAMPDSMQEYDAILLREELGVNAVRTSHYPQAQSFLNKCDEIGLLVFTEIPGWQHIGGAAWKDKAVENVKDMIRQNINHPSIILWGVRINESVDDEEFYARTNAMAHTEDPGRQTGGVRCYKKGIFQEDVFTYNDFSHCGGNAGVLSKSSVTADVSKPYLVTEYNGHMFPTKAFDPEEHRCEHMLRHAAVLDGVASHSDIAGSFGWCMFDYNTHKDFGSGDRICYHGVCDIFRNRKLAGFVYAAQQDTSPVLALSSSMNIGEHPACITGDVYIISNADSVRMYRNDEFVKEYTAKDSPFKNLAHGPMLIDDYIGDALEVHEEMTRRKAREISAVLNGAARRGIDSLGAGLLAKAGLVAAKYHMRKDDLVELFYRYIGNWGQKSITYKFEAVKNGDVVRELIVSTVTRPHLDIKVSSNTLFEGKTYDVALVRLHAVDENRGILPFCNDPVTLSTAGPIDIIGPKTISLSGGMGGVYVRSTGAGDATLTVTDAFGESTDVEFSVLRG